VKAIIMAGGEGSRLRPLTCGTPKPMVPVMNRPIMSYIIELLKKHDLRDIGVTLQYMPDVIRNYFGNGSEAGVSMRYFVEETPLGTAGSVKNASGFLDQTFVIISGDALTDFNLEEAIAYHKQKGALATMVLTKVEYPLEYGVVITGEDGRIVRFLEKPSWGEVFSDTVNTGIYIMEPEVLEYIPEGKKFDFSKELFPLLLEKGEPLYGVALKGYWCDIGDLRQYLQAHFDFLSGIVKLDMAGRQIKPGIFVQDDAQIHETAQIRGPVFIGAGTTIGEKVEIEPLTVIGSGCLIQDEASIKRSVLWNNVLVGPGANLRGAVVGGRVQVRSGSSIYEGAVIGNNSVIGERCVINPDVKLWPHKTVEAGTVVRESVIWGSRVSRRVFGLEGVSGTVNVDITPEFAARLAAAYASVIGAQPRVAVSSDIFQPSRMIRDAVVCGLQSVGARVFRMDDGITPMHRFAVRKLECDGGIHVRFASRQSNAVNLLFTNKLGGNISRSLERKVENLLAREDFQRADHRQIKETQFVPAMPEAYLQSLLQGMDKNAVREAGLSMAAVYDRRISGRFLESLCRELNLHLERIVTDNDDTASVGWTEYRKTATRLAEAITERGLSMGVVIDTGADNYMLIDDRGRTIQEDMLLAILALMVLRSHGGPVVVPVTAPQMVEKIAQMHGARVVRTKTAVQDFYEKLLAYDGLRESGEKQIPPSLIYFDAMASICMITEYLAQEKTSLSELIDEIPSFFMHKKEIQVPWQAKGKVIRSIIEEMPEENLELLDGVKVFHPDGWALVLPDPEKPLCRVFSEGTTMEVAESLAEFYTQKIINIAGAREENRQKTG